MQIEDVNLHIRTMRDSRNNLVSMLAGGPNGWHGPRNPDRQISTERFIDKNAQLRARSTVENLSRQLVELTA